MKDFDPMIFHYRMEEWVNLDPSSLKKKKTEEKVSEVKVVKCLFSTSRLCFVFVTCDGRQNYLLWDFESYLSLSHDALSFNGALKYTVYNLFYNSNKQDLSTFNLKWMRLNNK